MRAPDARRAAARPVPAVLRHAVLPAVCAALSSLLTLHLVRLSSGAPTGGAPDPREVARLLTAAERVSSSFTPLNDSVAYSRYARLYQRAVRHPDGRVFSYDVVGRVWRGDSFGVVAVVPFDAARRTFTLVREYSFAHARGVYSFPQGCFERGRHSSVRDAAEKELDEEARLRCPGALEPLVDEGAGSPQDKFQREKVFFFLCVGGTPVEKGRDRDAEEVMQVERGVRVEELLAVMKAGAMQTNNVAAGLLAVERLREMGLL